MEGSGEASPAKENKQRTRNSAAPIGEVRIYLGDSYVQSRTAEIHYIYLIKTKNSEMICLSMKRGTGLATRI